VRRVLVAQEGGMIMKDAFALAKMGIRVMPVHGLAWHHDKIGCTCGKKDCKSVGKHPIFHQWQKIMENDFSTISRWYQRYPWANLGVITGKVSNLVVLDIDPKNGGYESLQEVQERYGEFPETPQVTTGSGGAHYYFKHPGFHIGNRAGFLGKGIDFRGDGGFVVAPKSAHASGSSYEWEISPQDCPFSEMPPWLLREIQSNKPKSNSSVSQTGGGIMIVAEGGRDNWLMSVAGGLRRKGLGYKPIMACLWYSNLEHCNPPLPPDDVKRIAKSVCLYPPGENFNHVRGNA
jgi:hypothetical protein